MKNLAEVLGAILLMFVATVGFVMSSSHKPELYKKVLP